MKLDVFQHVCHTGKYVIIVAAIIALSACQPRNYKQQPSLNPSPEFQQHQMRETGPFQSTAIVDQIDRYYRGTNPGPIGVTTFVNVDDLTTTSTFGRMYGEQVISELALRGFDVVELRHSDALHFLSSTGEFALSRDVASVRRERDLGGVIVGTYVVSPAKVYVNARLVDPATSIVLSAGSVSVPKNVEIAKLLRGGSFPATLERIPVKHLGLQQVPMNTFSPYQKKSWEMEEAGYPMMPVQPLRPEPQMIVPPVGK